MAYGPVAIAATAIAIVGHLRGWAFAEAPLVVLSLPYSVVPLALHVEFVPLLAVCVAVAAVVWSRMSHSNGRTPQTTPGRVVALCGLWVAVGVGVAGMILYDYWYGPWTDLRHSVAEFGVSPGFNQVATIEAGNEACIIECSSPRVALVLTTSLSPSEACASVESKANAAAEHVQRSAPPMPYKKAFCYMQGDLAKVGPNATLTAAVFRGADLPPYSNLVANANTPRLSPDDTIVALLFNSENRLELDRPFDLQ